MLQRIEKIWSEKGQGIVEYALILAFVVGLAIVALSSNGETSIGQRIQTLFTNTGQKIEDAGNQVNGQGNQQGGNG